MRRLTGGCLCGNVLFVASGLPYRVGLCHCLDCRKHHGALFHASAVFPQDAVTIDGETRDYAGRFFFPAAARPFRPQRGRDRGEPGLPGRPRPTDADLRELDRPSRNPGCRRSRSRGDTTAIVTPRVVEECRWLQACVRRLLVALGRAGEDLDAILGTPTVCSNWAERERSLVTVVQPSLRIFTAWPPALIIGSMVNSMPGLRTRLPCGGSGRGRGSGGPRARRGRRGRARGRRSRARPRNRRAALGHLLDRPADIIQRGARPDGLDAGPHRLVGALDQQAALHRHALADVVHPARVAVPAVEDHGDVDVQDVARPSASRARPGCRG